ncbi:hypothetical protein N9X66_00430 [Gammaproteobacteria bacterium]|nr:hypothetical protein [Gammaproteobacteria bacterium]
MLDYNFYHRASLASWTDSSKNLAADFCNGPQSAADGTFLIKRRAAVVVRPTIYRTYKKSNPLVNYNLSLDRSIYWTGSRGIYSNAEHCKLTDLVS